MVSRVAFALCCFALLCMNRDVSCAVWARRTQNEQWRPEVAKGNSPRCPNYLGSICNMYMLIQILVEDLISTQTSLKENQEKTHYMMASRSVESIYC